jgi:hypothetical protein
MVRLTEFDTMGWTEREESRRKNQAGARMRETGGDRHGEDGEIDRKRRPRPPV